MPHNVLSCFVFARELLHVGVVSQRVLALTLNKVSQSDLVTTIWFQEIIMYLQKTSLRFMRILNYILMSELTKQNVLEYLIKVVFIKRVILGTSKFSL